VKLYRVMKVHADGQPLVGNRRNMLGVRPTEPTNPDPNRRADVDAVAGTDPVLPGTKNGLSVETTPDRLQPKANEAIFEIEEATLLAAGVKPVPDREPHHILEPVNATTLDDYQARLLATRAAWVRVS
jgi:hypothetical protein